ncbi:hypothetical protein ACHAWF_011348 [Thalassiosira exigua]
MASDLGYDDGGADALPAPPPASEASVVTVLISRNATTAGSNQTRDSSAARIAAVVRSPHRGRTRKGDRTTHDLRYYSFLDDRRSFANVDALLTRCAPVGAVYVACADEGGGGGGGSAKKPSKGSNRAAAEARELTERLASAIQSREDIAPDDGGGLSGRVLPPLSKAKALDLADSCLLHLLGGERSPGHVAYRGDRSLAEDPLALWCLGHFFNADPSHSHRGDETRGTARLAGGTLDGCLKLDRTAAEAVHLMPPTGTGASLIVGGSAGTNSLFGVLNRCKTKMGSRTLEMWLRQPLVDLPSILRRQNAVARLVGDSVGLDRLRDEGLGALRGQDADRLARRLAEGGRAARRHKEEGAGMGSTSGHLEALYLLHVLADKCLPPLLDALEAVVGDEDREEGGDVEGAEETCALRAAYDGLCKARGNLDEAVNLAEEVIDFDAAPRHWLINARYDEALGEVRAELDGVQEELREVHALANEMYDEVSGMGNDKVKLEDCGSNQGNSDEWQFRIVDSNASKILQGPECQEIGVCVHRILKNGVYFSTKELQHLGVKKRDLVAEYQSKQGTLVSQIMTAASTYAPVLEGVGTLLAELDVLASFAHVAAHSSGGYCRPEMTDGEEDGLGIQLKDARHPCVELQEGMTFIANDFNMCFGTSSFLLVTGPNMGGKSTYIRSLGAIVTMAQVGSFVPCSSAKINIVHHILARVGAGDAQDRGISTFMAEMLESSSILRTSTKRSLIIIDELGRGTSTFDGYGLARAISEHIIQTIGCITVFATHFHELTALEEQETSAVNAHVTACRDGRNGLTFLYEVQPGPCLESFGIQVAEMADMPSSVIADAKRKAKQLENFDYRKRPAAAADVEDITGGEGHDVDEKTAKAMEFLHKFRKLPVDKMNRAEMQRTIVPLLRQYAL